MRRLGRVAAVVALCTFPQGVRAGAWTQPAGQGQLIVNLSFTGISHEFDGAGNIKPFGDAGRFQKLEINPYFEYGWNARTTVVVDAFLPALDYSNHYGSNSSFGLGDVETGIRRRLNSTESRTAISAQFTVKLPAYSAERNPAPGNHQTDGEAGLLGGRGFEVGQRHTFVSFGAAYRYRNGPPADEFRSEATWGMDVSRRVMVMAQYSGITGMRNPQAAGAVALNNPNLRSDFDLYKGQVSLVARVNRTTQVQCGWIDAFAGRNTGHGSSVLIALWRTF